MKTNQIKKMAIATMSIATMTMATMTPILADDITGVSQHALVSPPHGNIVMNMLATGAMFGILGVTFVATKNRQEK